MEDNKQPVEPTTSSAPPLKKIKLDSEEEGTPENKSTDVSSKDIDPVQSNKAPDSKKHAAEDSEISLVPNKKLKQDHGLTPSDNNVKETTVTVTKVDATAKNNTVENKIADAVLSLESDKKSVPNTADGIVSKQTESKNTSEPPKASDVSLESKSDKSLNPPKSDVQEIPNTVGKTEINKSPVVKSQPPTTGTQSAENTKTDSTSKPPPPKVLKKLPGLNPIRPISTMTGPQFPIPKDSLLKQQLSITTESMGAPAPVQLNRSAVSPARQSPCATSPKSPVRSPSPVNSGVRISPVKQMGGATLSPVPHMGGATISPVRKKSPVPQLQRGGLTISPVKQQISPNRQARNEVNMTPFFSGEVSISAFKQQGVTISPVRQPQLSAEIRSQIPEGISITAIPSMKAKSPIRQTMPRPQVKVGPAPKSMGQQIRPQTQMIRKSPEMMRRSPEGKTNVQKSPIMVEPSKKVLATQPKAEPQKKLMPEQPLNQKSPNPPANKPKTEEVKPTNTASEKTPTQTSPSIKQAEKLIAEQNTPTSKQEISTQDVEMKEVSSVNTKGSEPSKKVITPNKSFEPGQVLIKTKETKKEETVTKTVAEIKTAGVEESKPVPIEKKEIEIVKKESEIVKKEIEMAKNESEIVKKDSEIVKKESEIGKKESEIVKKANEEKEKDEESSSEGESSNEDSESEGEEEDNSKSGPPTRVGRKRGKAGNTSVTTPARSLRTRKSAVDVAVKLTRIDLELEDGALPAWNIKKHMQAKPAQDSDNEEEDNDEASDDDNSNSLGSKSAQSATTLSTRKRGRPRKVFPNPVELEDLTSHDSLHEVLKKIIEDEGLEAGPPNSESEEQEEDEEEGEGRKATKALLSLIPFFSRRGGRGGVKGKAIGKNNQFDNRVVEKLECDKKFRTEMLKQYQEDRKKREEKKQEKIAELRKKSDERQKAAADKKEKLRMKAEERRRKYEEQKLQRQEEAKKREEAKRLRASLVAPVMNFDDDTRMSFPNRTPSKMSGKLESLEDGEKSESRGKRSKMEIIDFDSQKEFPVHALAEYQWPLQGGEHFMIQEQVAAYLEIKSFKRKYPDLKRRGLEPEERTYICDSGLVSESMIELGLTAVQSADIMDIMFVDFPEKYEEVKKFMREKQAKELIDRQRAMYDTTISEQTAKDLKESLVEAAALWNAQFNRMRRENRQGSLDLQTFIVHVPAKVNPKPAPKVGHYPVAILPGQYCDYYKEYTPTELRYLPLNTVIYGPMQPNERFTGDMSYSEASQSDTDDSSDTSGSSSDSSSDGSSSSGSDDSSSDDEDTPKPLPQTPLPKKQSSTGQSTPTPTPVKKQTGGPVQNGGGGRGGPPQRKASNASAPPTPRPASPVDTEMEVDKEDGDSAQPPPPPSSQNPNCKSCDRDSTAGEMIRCGKCVRFLHPGCLDLPLEMLPHMKLYEWQCSDCKSCVTCEKAQDDDKMLFCDLCDRGYHNYCIGLDRIPTGRWHCKVCAICAVCSSTDPNPEWEHEVKKGVKGQSVYQRSLCTPCAKKLPNKENDGTCNMSYPLTVTHDLKEDSVSGGFSNSSSATYRGLNVQQPRVILSPLVSI
uniref:PHD finger protein 10 n=1 Tax=Cacopsylla melanoneura TaxID=428564 RepID=A0A8D8XT42_9HEMI